MAITLNEATLTTGATGSSITLSPPSRKNLLVKAPNDEKIEYITFVDRSKSKGNQVAIINQLVPVATKLASMNEYVLPDRIMQILNTIFKEMTSVLFGPHTDVYWPLFTNILLLFLK